MSTQLGHTGNTQHTHTVCIMSLTHINWFLHVFSWQNGQSTAEDGVTPAVKVRVSAQNTHTHKQTHTVHYMHICMQIRCVQYSVKSIPRRPLYRVWNITLQRVCRRCPALYLHDVHQ